MYVIMVLFSLKFLRFFFLLFTRSSHIPCCRRLRRWSRVRARPAILPDLTESSRYIRKFESIFRKVGSAAPPLAALLFIPLHRVAVSQKVGSKCQSFSQNFDRKKKRKNF